MLGLLALIGVAMVIAALVRPFRRASEAEDPYAEARAMHEEEDRIAEIEREKK